MDVLAAPTPLVPTSRPIDPRSPGGVARGFESMFLSLLMKEMRQSLESETLFDGDKSDILGGLFDQMMGEFLAKGEALGIASMVRKQLEKTPHGHDSNRYRATASAARPLADPTVPRPPRP